MRSTLARASLVLVIAAQSGCSFGNGPVERFVSDVQPVSMEMPGNWSVDTLPEGDVALYAKASRERFTDYYQETVELRWKDMGRRMPLAELGRQVLEELPTMLPDFYVKERLQVRLAGDLTAMQIHYTAEDGTVFNEGLVWVFSRDTTRYALITRAHKDGFAVWEPVFRGIADSIQFSM